MFYKNYHAEPLSNSRKNFPFSNFPSPQQINRENFFKNFFSPRVTVATWKKASHIKTTSKTYVFRYGVYVVNSSSYTSAPPYIITSHRHRNNLGTRVKSETFLQHLAELKREQFDNNKKKQLKSDSATSDDFFSEKLFHFLDPI